MIIAYRKKGERIFEEANFWKWLLRKTKERKNNMEEEKKKEVIVNVDVALYVNEVSEAGRIVGEILKDYKYWIGKVTCGGNKDTIYKARRSRR